MNKLRLSLAAIVFAATSLLPTSAVAESEQVGDYTWTYDVEDGKATITGVSPSPTGELTIPSELGRSPVTSIGTWAFAECQDLRSVTIPEGVTSIGAYAFAGCYNIGVLTVPASVRKLGDWFFDGGVLRLECPMCAFTDEEGYVRKFNVEETPDWLREVLNADGIYIVCAEDVADEWEDAIFYGGFNLEQGYNWNVKGWSISGQIEDGCVSAGFSYYGDGMAWDGTETLTLPAAVGPFPVVRVFGIGLDGPLEKIVFPASVKAVDDFCGVIDSGTKTIEFLGGVPNGITECLSGLHENEVAVLYPEEFADDWKLFIGDDGKVKFDDRPYADVGNIRYWLSWCDGGWSIAEVGFVPDLDPEEGCEPQIPETLTLPARLLDRPVKGIGGECAVFSAFGESLHEVVIPGGYESISAFAFDGCYGLRSVTIPEGVTSIGAYAFAGCYNIGVLTVPASVRKLGDWFFEGGMLCLECPMCTFTDGEGNVREFNVEETPDWLREVLNADGIYIVCAEDVADEWEDAILYGGFNLPENYYYWEVGDWSVEGRVEDGHIVDCRLWYGRIMPESETETLTLPDSVGPLPIVELTGVDFGENDLIGTVVIPEGYERIGDDAFEWVWQPRSLIIPSSVTSIGEHAFQGCLNLLSVCFVGDMPECSEAIYGEMSYDEDGDETSSLLEHVKTYVREGTSGWGEVPGTWQGRPIKWWTSYPEIPGPYEPDPYEPDIRVVSYGGYDWTVRVEDDGVWIGDYSTVAIDPLPQGRLEIPAELLGMPVIGVTSSAFMGCKQLTEVVLPKSLAFIDAYSFIDSWPSDGRSYEVVFLQSMTVDEENPYYEMRDGFLIDKSRNAVVLALGKVGSCVVPGDIEEIDSAAFMLCPKLTEVTIPDRIEHLNGSTVRGCTSLVSIKVMENNPFFKSVNGLLLDKSGETLVACPEGIVDVVVPDGVKTIGEQAFFTAQMKSVRIPASVEQINGDGFSGCLSLTGIYVDPLNTRYSAKDGLLLTADGTQVIFCARGVLDANVPEGVTQLADGAFQSHWWLKSVTLPVTLERIGANAFRGCSELKSVTIPAGVTSIGSAAFAYCSGLTAVCFEGNAPEVEEGSSDDWYNVGFYGYSDQVTTYVREGTSGWGEVPGTWQGRPIRWWTTYPEPYVPMEDGVYVISQDGYDWTVHVEYGEVWIGEPFYYYPTTAAISPLPVGRLEIPAELAGMPVVGLEQLAFMECDQLTEVALPSTVRSVSSALFFRVPLQSLTVDEANETYEMRDGFLIEKGTKMLTLAVGKVGSCVVPEDVREIGFRAFSLCPDMTELTIPNAVEFFDAERVGPDCTSLVSIKVAEDHPVFRSENGLLLDKGGETLVACPAGIVDVIVPEGVKSIGSLGVISFSTSMTRSIKIPASVKQISLDAISGCFSLTNISIDPANAHFKAQNGLLLTADGKQLLACANGVSEVEVPEGVTSIREFAFGGDRLLQVTIPSSMQSLGCGVFGYCNNLTSVCFAGDAPDVYEGAPDDWWTLGCYGFADQVTTYVREGTSGWGEVPGTWQGRPIAFWVDDASTPIPEIPEDAGVEEIEEALVETTDEKVLENIYQTVEEEGEEAAVELYNAYRDWAGKVKGEDDKPAGLQAVCDSPAAWTSFALDSPKLLEKNPTDADLTVEEFKPSEESGTFDFIVSIKDVEVGSAAAAVNLKRTFGLEGATDLSSSKFDEANVDIVFGQPVDGNLKFTAEPKDKAAKSFFMKMRVR